MIRSVEELEKELDDQIAANELLVRENELFEAFLEHNRADVERVAAAHDEEGGGGRKGRGKGPRRAKVDPLLTFDQKLDVSSFELDAIQRETEDTRKKSGRLVDTLTAVLEETDMRIAELKKEAYEFKRDVVVGAENPRTGKTIAEKVIRYMEDKLRQKDAMIEKLRLKNATLKNQCKKVEAQLRQKEDMGEILHYIDFHQLRIENSSFIAKIDEKNSELLALKMTTGRTVQALNALKKRLSKLITDSKWLKQEIKERSELMEKLRSDNEGVSGHIRRLRQTGATLRTEVDDVADMPHVLDYVSQKAEEFDLKKAAENWERKVEIAEMAARTQRSTRRRAAGK